MMKVSDPVLFGHAVKTFFADVFERYGDDLAQVGANPDLGLADLLERLEELPPDTAPVSYTHLTLPTICSV